MDAIPSQYRADIDLWLEGRLPEAARSRYTRARLHFVCWLGKRGYTLSTLGDSEVDVLLARYCLAGMEDEDENFGRQHFVDLMAALKRRGRIFLPLSRKVLSEWALMTPARQAASVPREAAYAAAVLMSLLWQEHEAAIVTVLCFTGLLRFGEAAGLLDDGVHLATAGEENRPLRAVLDLGDTKKGFEERVVLTNPAVIDWLIRFVRIRKVQPKGQFASISYYRFTRVFREAMRILGLIMITWTSHGLRRGGATYLYECGVGFAAIRLFGRWATESSARLYIRSGANALLRLRRDVAAQQWFRISRIASVGPLSM